MSSSQTQQGTRKVSTACGACKQRKTKCSGSSPCEACATRGSSCVYDATSDQRRKIANQRNLHNLAEARIMIEKYQQIVGGMIAVLRADGEEIIRDLVATVRSGVDLSQLAAHIRNARRADPAVEAAFNSIDFSINDSGEWLPSANALLSDFSPQFDHGFQGSTGSEEADQPMKDNVQAKRQRRQRTGRIEDVVNPPISVTAKPWTTVTDDDEFVSHLISLWFTWAHPWWHWVHEQDFLTAMREGDTNSPICTSYLVNMILADSCLLDVLNENDKFSNVGLRDQFFAEAVRELEESDDGTASLCMIQTLGIQWTYLVTNGQDKEGHEVIHKQHSRFKELGKWRTRVDSHGRYSADDLGKIDQCMERVTWTMYALNAVSAMSSGEVGPPNTPRQTGPVHDHRIGGGTHVSTSDTTWMPYPESRRIKAPFHPECHYSAFLSLADVLSKDEGLLPQGKTEDVREISQQFYRSYDDLEDWTSTLPECLQFDPQGTPHVISLHALHHWGILSMSKEAAAAEQGHPNQSNIMGTTGIWQTRSINAARAISELMAQLYREWGSDHFPVIVTQPMSLALFTLLDALEDDENRVAFVGLVFSMHAAAKRFIVGKGILRLVQTTAWERGLKLPQEVEQLFLQESRRRSTEYPGDRGGIGVDYLLGKWSDFDLK